MDDAKTQLAEQLRTSNNILVTVSRNPSVDQLASCIALTLLLNAQNKHTVAVFSGEVPSTLEFLQPEETLEKNTDSLRDFIISLDKSKADKLRYKVEDNVVRIFITPYKTSIGKKDLEFTQGDFNVDVVVALGVQLQEDLDEAITAHGRILHDATLTSISTSADPGLGVINWHDPTASSLSELVTELVQILGPDKLDSQIATALLTGIVAQTERFSNHKTTPQTMSASAVLMAAGANQQLVVSELEAESPPSTGQAGNTPDSPAKPSADDDGMIEITHEDQKPAGQADDIVSLELPAPDEAAGETTPEFGEPPEPPPEPEAPAGQAAADDTPGAPKASETDGSAPGDTGDKDGKGKGGTQSGSSKSDSDKGGKKKAKGRGSRGSKIITEPPTLGGTLTANSQKETLEKSVESLGLPVAETPKLRDRKDNKLASLEAADAADAVKPSPEPLEPFMPLNSEPPPAFTPPPPAWMPPSAPAPKPAAAQSPATGIGDTTDAGSGSGKSDTSLASLEDSLKPSPSVQDHIDEARDEISRALNDESASSTPKPIQALGAQPLAMDLHPQNSSDSGSTSVPPAFGGSDLPVQDSSQPPSPLSPSVELPAPLAAPLKPAVDELGVIDRTAPDTPPSLAPPVPPPIPFQFGNPPPQPPR